VQTGRITREQAVARMREIVHALRYDAGSNYVLAQGDDGVVLMHGPSPDLEGKPVPADAATGQRPG
jgi:copper(I)-binding protein